MSENTAILTRVFSAIADSLAIFAAVFETAKEEPFAVISLLRELGWDVPFGATITGNAGGLFIVFLPLFFYVACQR